MFERVYEEFSFTNLNLNDGQKTQERVQVNGGLLKITGKPNKQQIGRNQPKFHDIIRNYEEKFILVTQIDRPLFLQISFDEIKKLFMVPICIQNGKCHKTKCVCLTSFDLGMDLYERGNVHNFHQMGNYIIGFLSGQHTDPLSKVAVKFDRTMNVIKSIYCNCKYFYCPHAFALLKFRINLKNFYTIKLPREIFESDITQQELVKFYAFLIEETRSLPILSDYHSRCLNYEQSYKQTYLSLPHLYAFCHKILLPLDYLIVEEQKRARKWISDLYMKDNCQRLNARLPNAGEIFTLHCDENSNKYVPSNTKSLGYKNNNNNNNTNSVIKKY